jgi:hypothetical protein
MALPLALLLCACGAGRANLPPAEEPRAVDLSRSKYFPPFAGQGSVASCDWFACAYYQMTYMNNRRHDRAADPSNTFSPKFGFTIINNGASFPSNLWFMDVYDFLQRHGSPTIAAYPYDLAGGEHYREWCRDASIWQAALSSRIDGYEYVLFDLQRVKDLLASGEVLVLQFSPARVDTLRTKNNPGTTKDDATVGESIIVSGRNGPDHTVALVGFDESLWVDVNGDRAVTPDELGALKVVESVSGPGVNNGYRWISLRAVTNPVTTILFENKVWRMRIRDNYAPKVVAEITLNHGARDQLKMQFGRARNEDPADAAGLGAEYVLDPSGFGFNPGRSGRSLVEGCRCGFDGGANACDGSFAFDLTDLVSRADAPYWYFRVRNGGDQALTVKSFKIVDLERGVTLEDAGLPLSLSNDERHRFIHYVRD